MDKNNNDTSKVIKLYRSIQHEGPNEMFIETASKSVCLMCLYYLEEKLNEVIHCLRSGDRFSIEHPDLGMCYTCPKLDRRRPYH